MIRTRMSADIREWSRGFYLFKGERDLPRVYSFRGEHLQQHGGEEQGDYNTHVLLSMLMKL